MKRTERVGAIIKILTDSPFKVFPLQFFCDLFNTAKSSVSERHIHCLFISDEYRYRIYRKL